MSQSPALPEALAQKYALASRMLKSNDIGTAAMLFQQILKEMPQHAGSLHQLGIIAIGQNKADLALSLINQALAINPDEPQAILNKAKILALKSDFAGAAETCQIGLQRKPHDVDMLYYRGLCLLKMQQPEAAEAALAQAHKCAPLRPEILNRLGIALSRQGKLIEAMRAQQEAIEINETMPELYNDLGNVLRDMGRPDLAINAFAKAIELDASEKNYLINQALCHLLIGDYKLGIQKFEHRPIAGEQAGGRYNPAQRWQGEASPNGRLLLHAEQGLGDTLQFLRYVPMAAELMGSIILEIPESLHGIARSLSCPLRITTGAMPPAEYDWQCPLASLPHVFSTRLSTVPAKKPYLHANPALRSAWALKLSPGAHLCVGLVWAGNPGHLNDRNRSMSFATIKPLLEVAGVQFFSLQKGAQADEAAEAFKNGELHDWGKDCHDFSDTAAAIDNLDLIITVDTSVAHLAGAMGKPFWLLLPYCPDWRWLLGREDNPWYPSARLFRQSTPKDWSLPLQQLGIKLARLAAGDTSTLKPSRWHGRNLQAHPHPLLHDEMDKPETA